MSDTNTELVAGASEIPKRIEVSKKYTIPSDQMKNGILFGNNIDTRKSDDPSKENVPFVEAGINCPIEVKRDENGQLTVTRQPFAANRVEIYLYGELHILTPEDTKLVIPKDVPKGMEGKIDPETFYIVTNKPATDTPESFVKFQGGQADLHVEKKNIDKIGSGFERIGDDEKDKENTYFEVGEPTIEAGIPVFDINGAKIRIDNSIDRKNQVDLECPEGIDVEIKKIGEKTRVLEKSGDNAIGLNGQEFIRINKRIFLYLGIDKATQKPKLIEVKKIKNGFVPK